MTWVFAEAEIKREILISNIKLKEGLIQTWPVGNQTILNIRKGWVHVCPMKTQISLCIQMHMAIQNTSSEDSAQTV